MDVSTAPPPASAPLILDDAPVGLDGLHAVAVGGRPLALGAGARARMRRARGLLDRLVAEERLVYGVTTGYGPLATEHVGPARSAELQRNLVYHLAAGAGPPLSAEHTRAVMAARAVSLSRGHSALRPEALDLLLACLRHDVLPVIPSMGTVGASGDLTPLAHMTLALMGEGEVTWGGRRLPAAHALAACGLEPLALGHKEGLAFVNGTSAMTGIAAVTGVAAERAARLGLALTALYAELLRGRAEAYHPAIGRVRPHPGQVEALERLGRLLEGSARVTPHGPPPRLREVGADGLRPRQPLLQDPYTVRCAPQLYGAVLDVLRFHRQTVETELNSVTDNPTFFPDDDLVIHGGNFYGQHVSFAADALANAVVKVAVHVERAVARITDRSLNGGLPAFLQARETGLHSGFMGAQVTATAVVAEMRTTGGPASTGSIPTNANNQDVVTMGTIAARRAADLTDHLYTVLAVGALVLAQGLEIEGGFEPDGGFAPASVALARWVRERSPFLDRDRPLHGDIAAVAQALRSDPPPDPAGG